jgi:hypothetical protein
MQRFWKSWVLAMIGLLIIGVASFGHPRPALAQGEVPVSVTLTGWGWYVGYRDIGNIAADLTGFRIPRDNATEVEDIYLEGILTFNTSERSDTFDLVLRGTKARSLFFLRQVSPMEDNVTADMVAEFEGTWLNETDYVACEGRILLAAPNHVGKPYLFVLRTADVGLPNRGSGGWVGNLEFAIEKIVGAFDTMADEISSQSSVIQAQLGDLLTKVAVLAREARELGVPYLP